MDEIVKAAMAKWPNVPACFGWLGLDARGDWWLRDMAAQMAGPFAGTGDRHPGRGSRIENAKLIEFIGRNYQADTQGRWYFQNGPQQVFVELECAPWVWRLQPDGRVLSHTGLPSLPTRAWTDEAGRLYLAGEIGLGVVHSQDMLQAAEAVEQRRWDVQATTQVELLQCYRVALSPATKKPGGAGLNEVPSGSLPLTETWPAPRVP